MVIPIGVTEVWKISKLIYKAWQTIDGAPGELEDAVREMDLMSATLKSIKDEIGNETKFTRKQSTIAPMIPPTLSPLRIDLSAMKSILHEYKHDSSMSFFNKVGYLINHKSKLKKLQLRFKIFHDPALARILALIQSTKMNQLNSKMERLIKYQEDEIRAKNEEIRRKERAEKGRQKREKEREEERKKARSEKERLKKENEREEERKRAHADKEKQHREKDKEEGKKTREKKGDVESAKSRREKMPEKMETKQEKDPELQAAKKKKRDTNPKDHINNGPEKINSGQAKEEAVKKDMGDSVAKLKSREQKERVEKWTQSVPQEGGLKDKKTDKKRNGEGLKRDEKKPDSQPKPDFGKEKPKDEKNVSSGKQLEKGADYKAAKKPEKKDEKKAPPKEVDESLRKEKKIEDRPVKKIEEKKARKKTEETDDSKEKPRQKST